MTIIYDKTLVSNADCTTYEVHTSEKCTLRQLVKHAKMLGRFFDIREGNFLGRSLYDSRSLRDQVSELMDSQVRLVKMSTGWGQESYVVEVQQ